MADRLQHNENLVQPRDFVDVLGTEWPFRTATITFYALATFIPATASELGRLDNPSLVVAMGIAAMSVLAAAALISVAKIMVPESVKRSPFQVVVVLSILGFTRGTLVSIIIDTMDFQSQSFLLSRAILGAISLPIVLALVSLVLRRISRTRTLRTTTHNAISTTERNRDRVLADIKSSRVRLVAEVDSTLRPAINQIMSTISGGNVSRRVLSTDLGNLVTGVIRPLSHELATTGSLFPAAPGDARQLVVPTANPPLREQFNPAFTAIGTYLGTGTVLLDMLPFWPALGATVTVGVMIYVLLRGVRFLLGNRTVHSSVAIAVVAAIHSVVWIPAHLINRELFFPPGFPFNPWVLGVVGSVLLGLLYQLIVLGSYSSRNQLARMDDVRVDMTLQLSEARRRAWLHQRHLTHLLHSSVQSRLSAEQQLVRSGSGKLSPRETTHVLNTLQSVLDSIYVEPASSSNAIQIIRDTIAFWSGMCDISLELDDRVAADIANTPDVGEAIQIVTLEMISNAIRHGRATDIDISIQRESMETIRVTAINNGGPVGAGLSAGLGMALYDELCANWEIRDGTPVTVDALIAARGNNRVESTI
jgi:signal transduction histidine kinase